MDGPNASRSALGLSRTWEAIKATIPSIPTTASTSTSTSNTTTAGAARSNAYSATAW